MKSTVKEPMTLLDFLMVMMQTQKKKTARQMLRFNGVRVDGRTVNRGDVQLQPGQLVEISRNEKPVNRLNCAAKKPIELLFEDDTIIVAVKPAGLLSISTEMEKQQTMYSLLYRHVEYKEGGRIFSVHRLDKYVAGVMVYAKSPEAKIELQNNWEDVQKRYVAMVKGKPREPEGVVETYLEEESVHKVRVSNKTSKAKYAITEYSTRKQMSNQSLLDINLVTGRRHQIRVHLAHLGCPIIGDREYGNVVAGSKDIRLFAYYLSFLHPGTKKRLTYKAPLPSWA